VKLDPEELEVSSFDTSAAEEAAAAAITRPTTSTDPTPQTHCFVCDGPTWYCV